MSRFTSDWSVSEPQTLEEQEEAGSESEDEHDLLDCEVPISVDEEDYNDYCPVNISHFDLVKKLGSGAYGTVFLVRKNCGEDKDHIYALKVIRKDEVVKSDKTITHMKAERKALELLRDCPYTTTLYYAFQTDEKLFLVMEYLPGGEMFTLVQKGALEESLVRFYMAELVIALEYIHKQNIVYRDIKLENVLIDKKGHIKLVDFGLCKKLSPRGRAKSFCGTVEYMPPEVVTCSGHSTSADWWALGVLAIELLTTVTPFGANDPPESNEILHRITNDDPIMPTDISRNMEDFISKLLIKNPTERLGGNKTSAEDIKNHPLFDGIDWVKMERKEIPSPNSPIIIDDYDTQHFSEEFTTDAAAYDPSEIPEKTFLTFKGYSYIAPDFKQTAQLTEEPHNDTPAMNIFRNRDPNSPFDAKYAFVSQQPLGSGNSSVCMKCIRLSDNTFFAVKVYEKLSKSIKNEIKLLQKAAAKKLKTIVHLVEVLTDSRWTYLIMELINGIDMIKYFSTISARPKTVYNAFNALLEAIESIHSLKYVHNRICFQNFFVLENGREFRLIGLSNAKPITHETDTRPDYWALGVCIYTVLCGHSPFDLSQNDFTERIARNEFCEDSEQWNTLSKDTKSFIGQLLCSSAPTCTKKQLSSVTRKQIKGIKYLKELVTENEIIIGLCAPNVENNFAVPTQTNAINGMDITTNGQQSYKEETEEEIIYHSESQDRPKRRNRGGPIESNGLNKKASSKRRLDGSNGSNNKNKKQKRTSEPFAEQVILPPEEIKIERPRRRPPINYANKINPKALATKAPLKVEIEEERNGVDVELPPLEKKAKVPKNKLNGVISQVKDRPTKAHVNGTTAKQVPKRTRKAKEAVSSYSSQSTITKNRAPTVKDQSVQTPFLFDWQKKKHKIPFYCFLRFDYK